MTFEVWAVLYITVWVALGTAGALWLGQHDHRRHQSKMWE